MLKFVVTTGTLPLHLPPRSSSPCSCSCSCSVVSSSFGHHRNRSRRIRRHHKKLKQSGPVTTTTTTTTSFEPKLETVIDLTHLTLFRSNIRRLVSSGRDAYHDLETLFTLDDNRRLLVSCRPSTLQFVGASAAFTFIAFSFFRVLVLFVSSSSSSRFWWSLRQNNDSSNNMPMVRRDRSLGGKEVVIGLGPTRNNNNNNNNNNTPLNLLIPAHRSSSSNNNKATIVQKKLPQWWPLIMVNANATDLDLDLDDYKRESSRVVRAIVDSRMAGQDISEHHIIQLRQLCRTSGVQVSVELTNIRDSLYRASVNFVLDACSSAPTYSTSVHFNGEDARQFLAGFAENIGLENVRAATIVSAAVAARTRSCLLQAWALEMQGKHVQTLAELSKICLLLQIFPPEESSPEMEMVSRGLEKHLKLEQRKHLMFLFTKVCSEDSHRIAKEALGLMHSQNCWADQFEDNIAP